MNGIWKIVCKCILVLLVALMAANPVQAVPPLPSSFYGEVKLNGQNVPDGTVVRALIGGQPYASGYTLTYEGDSVYFLDVPGDDSSTGAKEGGTENEVITFDVGGVLANETGLWKSGTNANLNLSVDSQLPIDEPMATPTPLPSQTAIQLPTTAPAHTATSQPAAQVTVTRPAEVQPAASQVSDTSIPAELATKTLAYTSTSSAAEAAENIPTNASPAEAGEKYADSRFPVAALYIPVIVVVTILAGLLVRKRLLK